MAKLFLENNAGDFVLHYELPTWDELWEEWISNDWTFATASLLYGIGVSPPEEGDCVPLTGALKKHKPLKKEKKHEKKA